MATKLGDLGGGVYGLRVSRPGFDVETEPLGSEGIAFDSRLEDFGIIHARGVWNWGSPIITFPTLPYVPLAMFSRVDSDNRIVFPQVERVLTQINNAAHSTTPFVGIVTQSTFEIRLMNNPYYGFNTGGLLTRFFYTIFAISP